MHVHSITISVPLIDSYKIAHARYACLSFLDAAKLSFSYSVIHVCCHMVQIACGKFLKICLSRDNRRWFCTVIKFCLTVTAYKKGTSP